MEMDNIDKSTEIQLKYYAYIFLLNVTTKNEEKLKIINDIEKNIEPYINDKAFLKQNIEELKVKYLSS